MAKEVLGKCSDKYFTKVFDFGQGVRKCFKFMIQLK